MPQIAIAPLSGEALAREVQKELKRVGCDPGSVDAKWGANARSALADFARRTQVALAVEEPTMAALESLKNQRARVCPLECDDDEVERDGRCVAASKSQSAPAAKARAKSCDDDEVWRDGRCVTVKRQKSTSTSSSGSTQSARKKGTDPDEKCWDFAGRLVRCRDLGGVTYSGRR